MSGKKKQDWKCYECNTIFTESELVVERDEVPYEVWGDYRMIVETTIKCPRCGDECVGRYEGAEEIKLN